MEQKIPTRNFELRVGILVACGFLSVVIISTIPQGINFRKEAGGRNYLAVGIILIASNNCSGAIYNAESIKMCSRVLLMPIINMDRGTGVIYMYLFHK